MGLHDGALSQRLLMDPDLTREKVKMLSRQREANREQQGLLHKSPPPPEDSSIAFLRRKKGQAHRSGGKAGAKTNDHQAQSKVKCTRCGKGPNSRQQCPANLVECHRCKKNAISAPSVSPRQSQQLMNRHLLQTWATWMMWHT